MNWATLLFYGWMQLACIPDGAVELYENPVPDLVTLDGSYSAELGAEITWGCFFVGGSMNVPIWEDSRPVAFWQTKIEGKFDAGIKLGIFRAGYMYSYSHSSMPVDDISLSGIDIDTQFNISRDMIYLRIEGGQR